MINTKYQYVKKPVKFLKKKVLKEKVSRGLLNTILPFGLGLLGFGILIYAIYPYAGYFLETNVFNAPKQREILTPNGADANVQGASIEDNSNINPADYYKNATTAIASTANVFQKDHPEYAEIKGQFLLTIDKLKIFDKPTEINVDSSLSGDYLEVLKHTLAHFKGSSIPGKPGNTFIYGHSARGSIFGASWESVFSGLRELDVGDSIKIKYDGVEYNYAVTKWKITDPYDTSVVLSTSDKQTLTLMTCYPAGIGNKRLIVSADRIY